MLHRANIWAITGCLVLSACTSGPTVVRANQFEIVDAKGRVRGTVERRDGKWVVVSDKVRSMS